MRNILITLWYIIFREMLVFLKMFRSKIIDVLLITFTNIVVFTYLMPYFGLKATYGPFIAIGLVPVIVFFEVIPRTTNLVMDMTGNKKISYLITLPAPSGLILTAIPIGWALCAGIYTILILPLAKLLLLKKFDMSHFSIIKFAISFITIQIMYGFFAFWLTSLIKDIKYISWIWSRVVNPLFMFGGFFYTWKSVFSMSHLAGYINLINPVLLACESMRVSVLGQKGFLPFGYTILALWGFIAFFALLGVIKIKKRLDCV